jgi:hypothetical protein
MIVPYIESVLVGNPPSNSEEEKNKIEEEDTPAKRELRIKNAIDTGHIFQKKNNEKIVSHISKFLESNYFRSDSNISYEENKSLRRDMGIILGYLLISGDFPFSNYLKVLVPIYQDVLLVAKGSFGSSEAQKIGYSEHYYYYSVI